MKLQEGPQGHPYVLEENTEVWVSLRVDGGLEHWHEHILQHLSKVWKEVLRSKHITRSRNEENLGGEDFGTDSSKRSPKTSKGPNAVFKKRPSVSILGPPWYILLGYP